MSVTIESYQKTNRIIWVAISSGIILLTVIILVFDNLNLFYAEYNLALISKILFVAAIAAAIAILILKRTVFRLDRILERSSAFTQTGERVNYVLAQLRRNYLILWTLAESIGTIGFVYYIFTADMQNYLLFAAVSIFSLVSNFPNKETIRISLENLGYSGSLP
jgi:hypothetical protein